MVRLELPGSKVFSRDFLIGSATLNQVALLNVIFIGRLISLGVSASNH